MNQRKTERGKSIDILSACTPGTLLEAIGNFLNCDYSQEGIAKDYSDARKQAHRISILYSAFHDIPTRVDDPLDGLQGIRKWCEEAIRVVDDIPLLMGQEIIGEVITQFGELKNLAAEIRSLVDIGQRNKLLDSINTELETKYQNEKEQISKLTSGDTSPLLLLSEIAYKYELDAVHKKRRAASVYVSNDPTFEKRIHAVNEKIFNLFETINGLIGDNTSTGRLLDLYCKLNDIPCQVYFDDLRYAFQNLPDIIFDDCMGLFESIDKIFALFCDIHQKASQRPLKVELEKLPEEGGCNTEQSQQSQSAGKEQGENPKTPPKDPKDWSRADHKTDICKWICDEYNTRGRSTKSMVIQAALVHFGLPKDYERRVRTEYDKRQKK